MPETPVEQRLERRGLEGTGDLSAVLEDIEDEAAEDALIRKKLDERARRRDEERSLLQQQRAARDAGRAAHVPGQGAARRTAMEQSGSESDEDMAPSAASAPLFAQFPGASEEVVASSLALNEQIIESTFDVQTFFLEVNTTSFESPSYDRVVQVALATGDSGVTFSRYLKPTSRVMDDAYDYHGLNGAKLDELGACDATEALSEMVDFIEEQSDGRRSLFVGWNPAFALSCLVETMKECQVSTEVLQYASYLDVKKVAPDAVVKETGSTAELSKTLPELFADYTSVRHPTQHYDAVVRVAMIFVVFACLLELKGWAFDAAAAIAQGPEAIPRLLEGPSVEVPDSDDALPPTSLERRPVDCWRGVDKATGVETFSITCEGLGTKLGISGSDVSRLSRIETTDSPKPYLVQLSQEYEVERLRVLSWQEYGEKSGRAKLLAAWDARRDGSRKLRSGWLELARDRNSLRSALKREFADVHRAALGLEPLSADETMEWFRTNYTWPQCPCVGGPLAACVKCTKCGKCVRQGNGQAFEHSELTDTELAEIPGGLQMLLERGIVPAAAGAGAAAARARIPPKILVAFHRLLPTCNKCNWRVVDYVDRLGLGKVPGMAARRRAVKAHTDACAKMAGV
jgi:hypothetical protein